jgi:TolB protein
VTRASAGVLGAFAVVAAALGPPARTAPKTRPPQREAVLKQVAVPHPYYWREMYVPQVTSGPAAPAWSPDGAELVYAMQGSLWRQKVGRDEARQITNGPGYDHQPDWSPDGRSIVYVSYHADAIELRLLDLASGLSSALVLDGAVNVDPRFSPDGRRIVWVSSAYKGRWHVFLADLVEDGGVPGGLRFAAPPTRLTEDVDSGLPRYYYSRFDHYLSPSFSPDGRELILVSNRGRIHGTGGFWRMEARPGAPMRALHYEETTWRARPDWSRDGRRVVFASYHGRQWHQLWLTTAEGGDPFPLTYGEHDVSAPRFSPDARRIAYVSNETGDTSVWVLDVPGGSRQQILPRGRIYLGSVGRLEIQVADARPARVSVTGVDGRSYAPDDAWRHGDEAFVRGESAWEEGYFHTPGRSTLTVPAGTFAIEAWRGPEFAVERRTVTVAANGTHPVPLTMTRLADLPQEGRWGGDLHVHMNYGGAYRNTPARLALTARAEGLHVVENLVVNKEQRIPDIDAFRPGLDPVSTADLLLAHGQEFHTSVWGHLGLLGMRDHYLLPDYAGYANTAAASLAPTNADVSDLARAQGGLVGYVHPFDTPPDPDDRATPLSFALPVDVALGKADYFEVMGYSDHVATSEVWYRLLNCGFRLPAGAGTDAFPNFASLRGPVGLVRVYVKAGKDLAHEAFLDGLAKGRTFVTNGPLLWFSVEGEEAGAVIARPAGTHRLSARVRLVSAVPVDHLEVIGNGRVVATVPLQNGGTAADATVTLDVSQSGWFVLRARADRPRRPVLDLYPFASTSPVYVELGGLAARSPEDAAWFSRWIARVEETALAHAAWNSPRERQEALAHIARARAEMARRGGQ